MLSDEEKQAIKDLIDSNNLSLIGDGTCINSRYTIGAILNLIEKQSKEIEILNENMNLLREQNISYKQSIHGLKEINKIINKKWKAKIEEVSDGTYDAKIVLQSLLKRE